MHKLLDFEVDGQKVVLFANTFTPDSKFFDPDNLYDKTLFTGQKIHHPFLFESDTKKNYEPQYKDCEISDGVYNKLLSAKGFHVKHDGSCGALVHDGKEWKCYARFDIKRDKSGFFSKSKITDSWIQCEPEPIDPKATHWPHFRPCDEDPKAYKWYLLAFEKAKKHITNMDPKIFGNVVTVEFMGKKFNQKDSDSIDDDAVIIIHGSLQLLIPEKLRNFNGFRKILEALPVIEGIVVYVNGASPMKIRRENFEGLDWPAEKPLWLKEKYNFDTNGLSNEVALR